MSGKPLQEPLDQNRNLDAFRHCHRRGLAAQKSSPVIFRGNCNVELPGYQGWFQQTGIVHGEPYRVRGTRKQQLLRQYSHLKLQMSLREVEELLGNPDFSTPRPAARLGEAPEPASEQCSNQVAYIIEKNTENMADLQDVAIYLFFSEQGKLYWAAPQNLPDLKQLGSPTRKTTFTVQSQTASWKEYMFAADGFAITLPYAPNPHPDPTLLDMTVYTVSLPPDAGLSLLVSHQDRDCAETLAQLKDGALKGNAGIDPSSVKDVSVNQHPGLEYEYKLAADRASDRFYCVNGRFYVFSTSWPSTHPRPAAVVRIISSFRLLDAESNK